MALRRFKLAIAVCLILGMFISAQTSAATIELWVHEFPPLQDALTQKWIPEFEAANPGVKVNMTALPFTGVVSYDVKLLTALSQGGGPDLWDMGSWEYDRFIENEYLQPLDPTLLGYSSTDDLLEDYVAHTLDFATYDGDVYALFSEYNTLALFYNKELFDARGVPYLPDDRPLSWEEVGEIASKLTLRDEKTRALKSVGYQFGFFANFRSPQWYAQNFYVIMRQLGQDDLYINGEPAANSEAAIGAFQVIYDYTHTVNAYDPHFISNWFGDFPQERVGMVTSATWFVPAIYDFDPEQRFGVVPHPVTDPEDKSTWKNIQYSWGWSVNPFSGNEKQQLAHEFLRFMLGGKAEADQPMWWFQNLGYLQPKKSVFDHPEYLSYLGENSWLKVFTDTFDTFELGYVQHSYDEPGAALVRAIDRIIFDGIDPKTTAALLQGELERGFAE